MVIFYCFNGLKKCKLPTISIPERAIIPYLNRGASYIDSPKWLKDKKSIINPQNNDNKCFQYAVTLAINIDRIKKILKEYLKSNLL